MHRVPHRQPAATDRPIGDLKPVLEDIAARGFCPKHVLDVGANHGWWSEIAKEVFPHAKFTLIEPQESMKPYLDSFCRKNPGARWINAGAGSEIGVADFKILLDTESSSFLCPPVGMNLSDIQERQTRMVTLDSIVFDTAQPLPDMVKVDVEGFELEVLRGAQRLLASRAVELFLIEVAFFRFRSGQPLFTEVVRFMAEQDYHAYDLTYFCRRPFDGALGLAEVVFAKGDGILRAEAFRW